MSAWDAYASVRTCTKGAKDRKFDQECRIGVSPVHFSGGHEYAGSLALEGESSGSLFAHGVSMLPHWRRQDAYATFDESACRWPGALELELEGRCLQRLWSRKRLPSKDLQADDDQIKILAKLRDLRCQQCKVHEESPFDFL